MKSSIPATLWMIIKKTLLVMFLLTVAGLFLIIDEKFLSLLMVELLFILFIVRYLLARSKKKDNSSEDE